MPFISYAQNCEDVILWRALRDVDRGFYVDVGAADPKEGSVTQAFYERGWSGVNIEPQADYFERLAQARDRDINLRIAVGREAGVRNFYVINGSGLSTLVPAIAAQHEIDGWHSCPCSVPVLPLTKALENQVPTVIHFLKIDAEGAEAEVLEGLDLKQIRPWIMVIEATKPCSRIKVARSRDVVSSRRNWENLVISAGYTFAYFDGLNCFYVADEVRDLKNKMLEPANVFDDFVRWPEFLNEQKAANLQSEVTTLRGQLETSQRAHHGTAARVKELVARSAELEIDLNASQTEAGELRRMLENERTELNRLLGRTKQLEAQLAVPSIDRLLGQGIKRLHQLGDDLTGGGLRSLVTRMLKKTVQYYLAFAQRYPGLAAVPRHLLKPFPRVASFLYRLETSPQIRSIPLHGQKNKNSIAKNIDPFLAAIPASARSLFQRLEAAQDTSGSRTLILRSATRAAWLSGSDHRL
jgi:FkbM family methyltransferase